MGGKPCIGCVDNDVEVCSYRAKLFGVVCILKHYGCDVVIRLEECFLDAVAKEDGVIS